MMYHSGEMVVYGNSGICEVADVGCIDRGFATPDKIYYTLRPVFSTETIYAPVDTDVFMRKAMTREEAQQLVEQIASIEGKPCADRNPNLLRESYEASLQTHDCTDLVRLIKGIHHKNLLAQESGRRISQVDQRYLKRAEELLYGELAVALELERDAVAAHIAKTTESLAPQC